MAGIGIGLQIGAGSAASAGGGNGLTASADRYAAGVSPGTVIATLSQPFGAATTYAVVSAAAQLALASGGRVVAGTAASSGGRSYAIKVCAASADGAREVAETFTLLAQGAAVAQPFILLNTPLITVGPSIQNVVNTRSPRMWLMAHAKGHFYPTPGTNAAVGGACATPEGAQKQGSAQNHYREPAVRLPFVLNQLGDPAARGRVLVQYDPGPNDLADIAGDGSTTYGVTAAKLIAAMDAWIKDVVTDRGHMIALCAIAISGSVTTNSHAAAARNAYNQAAAARHDPASGIFYCGSRLVAFDAFNEGELTWTSLTYDGTLHPNAKGADLIGFADFGDLAPYFGAGTLLRTSGAPFANAANALWNMPGGGGTAATGTSGSVATGWTAVCSTSATGVGGTIGMTAVCAAGGTRDFTVNGQTLTLPVQQIDLAGTPTADGFLRFEASAGVVKGVGAAQYFNTGEFGQASLAVEIAGSTQADPAGVASMGLQYGLLGSAMNKTVEASAGYTAKARQLVLRTVPGVSLKVNGAQKPEFALGVKSGVPVNIRLYIACLDCAQVETVAYAAPWNLSTAFVAGGATNPLASATKPSLSGTFTAGNTLAIAAPTLSGGGVGLYGGTTIRDAANAVLATIANTATTYSWISVAGDSGRTVHASVAAANGLGATAVDGGSYTMT